MAAIRAQRPISQPSKSSDKWKRRTAFAALCVLWGSGWIAGGTPLDQAPPLAMAAARFAVAAILLLPIVSLKRLQFPSGRQLQAIVVLSFTLIVLPILLLVRAGREASSETIAVFFASVPLIVVLFAPAFEGRSGDRLTAPPRRAFYASLFGLGGITLAVWGGRSFPSIAECALLLVAVISTAVSTIYAKLELETVNSWISAALQMMLAAVLLALASAMTEREQPVQWSAGASEALLCLGVLSGAGYAIYFWLLQEFEAYQVATIEWITPFIALLESAILWRERLSAEMAAGLAISLGSLLAVMRARAEDDQPVSLRVTE